MNTDTQTVRIEGSVWRTCEVQKTRWPALVDRPAGRVELGSVHLHFAVSSDEEHVQLQMMVEGRTFDMGARGHNYLLLTLARRRLADAARGFAETSCGWIDQNDLAHDQMMAPPRLNIDVFRIRKQFALQGVEDAGGIIERRPRAHQLRIGTGKITVDRI